MASMAVIIRRAEKADLLRITEIYNWAVENTTASFDINPQTFEQRADWFSHYNQSNGRYPLIVCEIDSVVTGYACLSEFKAKEGYRNTCEMSVYIHPDFQNKGIGSRLMGEIIKLGKDNGFHTIISVISSDNEISIKMHEKYGFKLSGHLKETGFKFGKYLDCLFYQLIF